MNLALKVTRKIIRRVFFLEVVNIFRINVYTHNAIACESSCYVRLVLALEILVEHNYNTYAVLRTVWAFYLSSDNAVHKTPSD